MSAMHIHVDTNTMEEPNAEYPLLCQYLENVFLRSFHSPCYIDMGI
jgi:hypothetical protein